ncbi:MAG: LON peptidase substrate-binding domain-containing protein [Pseudomonadota bacterium]
MASIPLFPLNTVLYPDGHLPLQVFEVRYLDMIKKCIANGQQFGIVSLQHGSEVRQPEQAEQLSGVGTMARILEWTAPRPGLLRIRCAGTHRFKIVTRERLKHGLWMAEVVALEPDKAVEIPSEQQNVANGLGALIRELQQRQVSADQMPIMAPFRLDECGWVANRWCELLSLNLSQKQRLLEQENPVLRLELIQDVLTENGLLG